MTRKLLVRSAAATAAVAVTFVLTAPITFAAGPGGDHGFGMRHRRDGHPFFGMLLIGLLIAGAVMLVVWLTRGRHNTPVMAAGPVPPSPTQNAESILAERLARGEISPDDYRASIAVLRE
jgi:uncharacterized membrane protein